ncbi:SDR family oxidoreductase [Rhodococcus sovatensis]|uniref:SDR family NAD(P)-dependent oxidoreductase n=1 Tax=Rhodococcus sovatensis TaxID=1805840 RepID=A0ABZ2PLA4_9NOCA
MPEVLTGRLALITGASGAIGSAISRRFVDEGIAVALLARNTRRLERLEDQLGNPDLTFRVRADVTEPFDLVEARDAIRDRFGRDPDLLVISAGLFLASSFENAIPSEWNTMIRTNVEGVLQTIQTFTDGLMAVGDARLPADIVVIGSATAEKRTTAFAVFSSISVAIAQLAKHLRDEFGSKGVRVHHVAPYYVTSQLGSEMAESAVFEEVQSWFEDYESIAPSSVADLVWLMTALPIRANLAEATIRAANS